MGGSYYLLGSNLGQIWPDWGNTARVDMAGLGSIGMY